MSKRLQVILTDEEMALIKTTAKGHRLSVGEWVRRLLRRAAREEQVGSADGKIRAVRRALTFNFPTADIDQMNREITEGYNRGLP